MRRVTGPGAAACVIVVLVNAVILGVELLAARILFPHFGNSLFTWSSVIAVVIAGLFAGYMAGGLLAEHSPDPMGLIVVELLAAGAAVAAVPWLVSAVLAPAARFGAVSPPLGRCLLIFGAPAALLAAVPPAAVGVLAREGRGAALASGIVSALSAAGSIVGTLATAYCLVPSLGVRSVFSLYAACLGVLALLAWGISKAGKPRRHIPALALYGLLAGASSRGEARLWPEAPGRLLYSGESAYQAVSVTERDGPRGVVRVLSLDNIPQGAMNAATGGLVWKAHTAYRLFTDRVPEAPGRFLFIGGGAYVMPLAVARALPRSLVEVSEIDPLVPEAAARYFGAADVPNIRTRLQDGRQVLRGRSGAYDGVFLDAFQGLYNIPFHLTTREFFGELRRSLRPGGVLGLNVIGDLTEEEGLFCSLTRTLASEFPHVRVYAVDGARGGLQNLALVASEDGRGLAGFGAAVTPEGLSCGAGAPLTDDWAPVEWLVGRYLRDYPLYR